MTPDREAPTRPRPRSRPAAPSPGPPSEPDRLPLPRPSLPGPPHLRLPQLQNRLPCSLPHASPQSCVQAPGAPWPARLFPGTVSVSLPPAPSLSPRTRPLPEPSRVQQTAWGWGALKAGVGGHSLPLASEWTVIHPRKVDSQPASRLLLPELSTSLTCSLLPRPKGGSRPPGSLGPPASTGSRGPGLESWSLCPFSMSSFT